LGGDDPRQPIEELPHLRRQPVRARRYVSLLEAEL
jgi:hypothetical protein